MAHFFQKARPIDVAVDPHGEPVGVTWQGEYHPVRLIINQWHEDRGWWQWRKWRAYYHIIATTHMTIEIFQELTTQEWYLQRLND